jgi:hypothetical protein
MLTMLLLTLSAAAATPSALPAKTPKCARADVTLARPADARARRLDQLPPGRLELTVLREIDRCPIPAVLREGIGGRR